MLASIYFRRYRHWGVYVHHDEGTVLGVDPPSQREEPVPNVRTAQELFEGSIDSIHELIDLLSPAETTELSAKGTESYRPNTAFIMMAIDKKQPLLEDVRNAIKEVFKEFGITAVTADEIEHEDAITDRILEEIETNEFLIADLTGERPNVYYEVGHAHARGKRVILYRQSGTRVHFDISHRNCPEYQNISDLKQQLRKRMENVTNKPRKA
jgi:nucleoside 2-deoxyribosyltransferase